MPEDIKLPYVAFPTFETIVKTYYLAYREGKTEISTTELNDFTKNFQETEKVSVQEASGSVNLLLSTRILEPTEKKFKNRLTQLGISLGRALKDRVAEKTSIYWSQAVENSDFIRELFYEYIKTVGQFSQIDLEKEIVYRANREPTYHAMRGATLIIGILEKSRYINIANFGFDNLITVNEKKFRPLYISTERINALQRIEKCKYDLRKMIELCNEINFCYENENYYAVGILVRSLLDHVPPIFDFGDFKTFAAQYKFGQKSSFRDSARFLEDSARNIADHHVHNRIQEHEELLKPSQIQFSPGLDMLLVEIINILNKQAAEIK